MGECVSVCVCGWAVLFLLLFLITGFKFDYMYAFTSRHSYSQEAAER